MKTRMPIRHGDINFHPVEKISGKAVKHNGVYVVGYGSTTGHSHTLTVKKPSDLTVKKDEKDEYYFYLLSDGKLTHEEHKTIVLPKGKYQQFQEEEVDHFAGSVTRKVID